MKNPFLLLIAAAVGYALAKPATPKPLTVEVVGTLKANGADLAAVLRTHDYRAMRAEGFLRPPAKSLDAVLQPADRNLRTS